jgi:hypothetical protein
VNRERKEAVVLVSSRWRVVTLAACATIIGLVIYPEPVHAATASPQSSEMTGGLSGVSCASAVSCMAVGSFTVGDPARPYVTGELYNGTSWRLIPMPEPKGASSGGVSGVSCASAVSCMAVGSFTVGDPARPYVTGELYNGTSWRLIPMPEPKGAS